MSICLKRSLVYGYARNGKLQKYFLSVTVQYLTLVHMNTHLPVAVKSPPKIFTFPLQPPCINNNENQPPNLDHCEQ